MAIPIALTAALLASILVAPVPALAVPPATTVSYLPEPPDGDAGWWVTAPLVRLTSDQDGTLWWRWDDGAESSAAAAAGAPVPIGLAPDGAHRLTAYAVNAADEVGSPALEVTVPVDGAPPGRPENLAAAVGSGIALTWDASADAVSGVSIYRIYRSTISDFTALDVVGTSLDPSYLDTPSQDGGAYWYTVTAVDAAGNESFAAPPVLALADFTPPVPPGDLQAWSAGRPTARVSFRPATDALTGVDYHEVERWVTGGTWSAVGTTGPDAWYLDDTAAGPLGTMTLYRVRAVDHAGLASAWAGPVTLLDDAVGPLAPVVTLTPRFSDEPGAHFTLTVSSGVASGAGPLAWVIDHGVAAQDTTTVFGLPPAAAVSLDTTEEAVLWQARARVVDRAGSVSATSAVRTARYVTVDRVWGPDRYRGAIALSEAGFTESSAAVVVSGRVFTDAMAASGLAGALRAPILLVSDAASAVGVSAELSRLGVTEVVVVGGPGTVPSATVDALGAPGRTIRRVWGPDRFTTAQAVAAEIAAVTGVAPAHAFVVSGTNFPDALSVGPAAWAEAAPVLFATRSSVPAASLNALAASGATRTVIVGGSASVWRGAEGLLPDPVRIGGADRYAVSRAFAAWAASGGVLDHSAPVVATGEVFSDALPASALAGTRGSVVLLVSPRRWTDGAAVLAPRRATVRRVTFAGGPGQLNDTVRRAVWARLSVP